MASLLLLLVCASCNCGTVTYTNTKGTVTTGPVYPRTSSVLISRKVTLQICIANQCKEEEVKGWGSGVIIKNKPSTSGILTAEHVCKMELPTPPDGITLKILKVELVATDMLLNTYTAKIIKTDLKHDMCILETEKAFNFPAVVLASEAPQPGDKINNIGSPSGFFKKNLVIIQEGIYNGDYIYENDIPIGVYTLMTFGGQSGSMLLNWKGELIGMIHSALSRAPIVCRSPSFAILRSFVSDYLR